MSHQHNTTIHRLLGCVKSTMTTQTVMSYQHNVCNSYTISHDASGTQWPQTVIMHQYVTVYTDSNVASTHRNDQAVQLHQYLTVYTDLHVASTQRNDQSDCHTASIHDSVHRLTTTTQTGMMNKTRNQPSVTVATSY